jgi:hypothetical protein
MLPLLRAAPAPPSTTATTAAAARALVAVRLRMLLLLLLLLKGKGQKISKFTHIDRSLQWHGMSGMDILPRPASSFQAEAAPLAIV